MITATVWMLVIPKEARDSVHGAAALFGISSSVMLVAAVAKTTELIGTNKKSSGYVFSCMSFFEKMSTGLVIFVIQVLKPVSENRLECSECLWFSKIVQTAIPGGFAIIGFLTMAFLFPSEYICIRKCKYLFTIVLVISMTNKNKKKKNKIHCIKCANK